MVERRPGDVRVGAGTSLDAARSLLAAGVPALEGREIAPVAAALGRVTATPIRARFSVPHFRAAAMDGVAVRASDLATASDAEPIELEAGEPDDVARRFAWIDTGQPLPAWADAVVMIEQVRPARASDAVAARPPRIRLSQSAKGSQHVRAVGEDILAGEPLLPAGHRLGPVDLAALLATGLVEVAVRPRPVVAILPTGDELVAPGAEPVAGRVVDSNSAMVAGFVVQAGGEALCLPPAKDDPDELARRVGEVLGAADVLCILAGSSAGRRDFTASVLGRFGTLVARGIDVIPGRPTILATLPRSGRLRAALGIPGYPVAAAVICRELVEPLVAHLLGASRETKPSVRAVLGRPLPSKAGQEELARVGLVERAGRLVAYPLGRGAGAIAGLARADGLARLPRETVDLASGSEVEVELLRPLAEIRGTVSIVGRNDAALAALDDALRATPLRLRLAVRVLDPHAALGELGNGEAQAVLVSRAELEADAGGFARFAAFELVRRADEELLLVLRQDFAAAPAGRALLAVLRGTEYRSAIESLAGYDASRSGEAARR